MAKHQGEFHDYPVSGYGSIPINTIFRGMNIHLPAILMWTTGVQGFDTLPCIMMYSRWKLSKFIEATKHRWQWINDDQYQYIYIPIFCLVDQTLWENSPSGLTNAMTSLAHRDPTRRGTEKQVEIIKVTRVFSDGRWPWVRSCLFNMSLWWLKTNLLWKMLHSWIFYLYFTTFFHILPIKNSDFPVRYVK